MTKKKHILVLGSEGFIGRNVVKGMLAKGYTITGADLLDVFPQQYAYFRIGRLQPEFDKVFISTKFDYCINAAGSGSVGISLSEPYRDFEANAVDTFKILSGIRLYNPECHYIHFSSAAVYGNPIKLPVDEKVVPSPVSPYGYHKWISEILCKEFVSLHGIKVVILRPFSVYGPGLRKQLIWDMYRKFKNDDIIHLHGTGNETRDFIFIDDIINSILCIIGEASFEGETYNVATGKSNTIKEVSECFNKLSGKPKKISFNNITNAGDPLYWEADVSKIKRIGFKPEYDIENGLKKTLNWMINQHD